MGLSKVISTLIGVISIATLILTLVSKSQNPPSTAVASVFFRAFGFAATQGPTVGPGCWGLYSSTVTIRHPKGIVWVNFFKASTQRAQYPLIKQYTLH